MWTEKFKKILSLLLIFSFFVTSIFQVPLLQLFPYSAYADEKNYYDLVAIIADEASYDSLKSKLIRYSKDVQKTLENTKVVILPTPSDASVFDIASLLEKLYFEGYKGVNDEVEYESRLVGTVLVGKIPVPLVFQENNSSKSLLPYIDFEEKNYIFNHENKKYEFSDASDGEIVPEIWHGVISPNTGDESDDIEALEAYFDKNHDFYEGENQFNQEIGVLDGKNTESPEGYEPSVFYYDQFRENSALQYQKYMGYEMYLQNIEDITYNRYSKELAEKVKDQILGIQGAELQDLITQVDPSFDLESYIQGPDVSSSSDILTRYVTDNTTKKFLEIFNASALGDMRTHVYNAGRYNGTGSQVHMDMPPFLISVIDEVSAHVIKNVNTTLEKEITNLVANGLSRKIAIPQEYNIQAGPSICDSTYHGFYYGKITHDISSAKDCSMYRGNTAFSGTLVASNRAFNIALTESDNALCTSDYARGDTDARNVTRGYWGGNSSLNLKLGENANLNNFELNFSNPEKAIRPLYDPIGSVEISDTSKNPSPLDCFSDGNFIMTYDEKAVTRGSGENSETVCELDFQAPVLGKARSGSWSCRTDNSLRTASDFFSLYNSFPDGVTSIGGILNTTTGTYSATCESKTLYLNNTKIKEWKQTCSSDDCTCTPRPETTIYKTIDSYILHTSPTDQEFGSQVQSMYTPSLPIDKNRYIDFIGARGGNAPNYGYQKIDFPQLFRIQAENPEDLDLEIFSQKVKTYLDTFSAQINQTIRDSNPDSLSGIEKTLYEQYFSTGEYPEDTFDLYKILSNKPLEVYTIDGQNKEISYYDTLVFAIYWNNLKTVSSKYKFIFENYLSNEFTGNDYSFALPRAKKSYETAYMAAPGDAENMYVKLDPNLKGIHPYADVLSQNLQLQGYLGTSQIIEPVYEEGTFECSPPDGVPIWEWIPAVICWLKEMLPPTIKISDGDCGDAFKDEEEIENLEACQGDVNKNGVNDCIENRLKDGSLTLTSDAGRYYYNTPGTLRAELYDNNDILASFDTVSSVKFSLKKLEIPLNPEIAFAPGNIKVIYDVSVPNLATSEARKQADAYINFLDGNIRVNSGAAKAYFYGRGVDVNASFQAEMKVQDAKGDTVIDLESPLHEIQVRGDRLFMNLAILDADGNYIVGSDIEAANQDNFCMIAENETFDTVKNEAKTLSAASEKLMLELENFSQAGVKLPLAYPLDLKISSYGNIVKEQKISSPIENVLSLGAFKKSGRYDISITDANGFKAYRSFDILPGEAKSMKIDISSSLMETGGSVSTHLVTLLDVFENPANAEIYNLEMEINGKGLVFDANGEKTISYNILEGYKAFKLRTTEKSDTNSIIFRLKDVSGNVISESQKQIQTIENIGLSISPLSGTPKVGGGKYKYRLRFTDENGETLLGLQSRAYLVMNSLYGRTTQPYVSVKNGEAEIEFQTQKLAARGLPIEIQLEGAKNIFGSTLDIHPDSPVQVELSVSQDKIEASRDSKTILQAVLKDRYGNEVYTDSQTRIRAEVADQSKSIITFDAALKRVTEGKTQFQIQATDIPGMGYFQVSTDPDLSQNSFVLTGQIPFEKSRLTLGGMKNSDNTLTPLGKDFYRDVSSTHFISKFSTLLALEQSEAFSVLSDTKKQEIRDFWNTTNSLEIRGVGKNASQIETFYFWGKDEIQGNSYNALYSVLAGAPYGDITQKDYLGGSLLFDKTNSSLAVTSLLNAPFAYNDVFSLDTDGSVNLLKEGDLLQDIQMIPALDPDGKIYFDIQNSTFSQYIGKLYPLLSKDSEREVQILEGNDYTQEKVGDDMILKNVFGQETFRIEKNGKISLKYGLKIINDTESKENGMNFFITDARGSIARLSLGGKFKINITRDANIFESKKASLKDTQLLYLVASNYSSRIEYQDNENALVKIYYKDPFADPETLDPFHENSLDGLENIQEDGGIGWEQRNAMLLQFSAGEHVGKSTKNFQSFSLINLGDPVVALKKLPYTLKSGEKKSFDPTVGEILEKDEKLIGFQTFDYNNDTRQDILTIHTDGYIQLYEGVQTQERFLKHKPLVYAADGGASRLVKTGDFTGDGYGDIFFVTEKGEPALFNNIEKDFSRMSLDTWNLSGSILQAEVYDMDNDTRDDIVTLDSAGSIHIFYGGGSSEAPQFTKKFIGDGYGLELRDVIVNHGGAIYFDGLAQINPQSALGLLEDAQAYSGALAEALENLNGNVTDQDSLPSPSLVDESLMERFLYVQLPYVPTNYDGANLNSQENVLDQYTQYMNSLEGSGNESALTGSIQELDTFLSDYSQYVQYSGFQNGYLKDTYFLRSQYANVEGIEVKKEFSDITPPYLQTGDVVYYDITLKNTSGRRKNNVAYVDELPKYFTFSNDHFVVLSDANEERPRKAGIGNYEILLDGFYLDPGEELKVRYELKSLPLSYGHMQVGLYESGEVGDDLFGDIILKEDNINCGDEADIYRSTAARNYQKGTTVPVCNAADIDIGNNFPELEDSDNDGVPDYLENLVSQPSETEAIEYAENALEELGIDSDGDTIPDSEDSMDHTDSATDFMGALDQINGAIDEISDEIDELIQGLSCGFGGGSCFANPLNWAPLAPGSAPILSTGFGGMPLGPLTPNTGIPVFSALTGRQASCGFSPCCLPSVYPMTSAAFIPGPFCGPSSAGGSRGTWASTNFVRVFITPTLTGGAGIAVCFGGPAIAAGNSNPMGVHPVVPGGNCIVAAMPLFGCEGDEGDPGAEGYPYPGDGFGVIHANCDGKRETYYTPQEIESAFVQEYLEYLRTGVMRDGFEDRYIAVMERVYENGAGNYTLPSGPLISIGNENTSGTSLNVDLDMSALASGNFQDVIQVENTRIGGFPNFMMDWVERQLDEVTSKLTNLPRIFVILPDFGGVFDFSWKDFSNDLDTVRQDQKQENDTTRANHEAELQSLRAQKSTMNCTGNDKLRCRALDLRIGQLSGQNPLGGAKESISGIKEAYEFLGNIPLVDIEVETISVNVPWIDATELGRFQSDWKYSLEQWKQEAEKAKNAWSFGQACTQSDPAQKQACETQNAISKQAYLDTNSFINSLENNIQILEEYANFPEQLSKLINMKEVWLEQILCNIEAIASLLGEWIGTNGERFKAWVELYILIKAILKSWQLFIDVFNGYEEECHECKNERQDLQNFVWRLISMVIPSPPIIQFPKWPDIILDLHNIRVGMTLYMPDFEMNLRPIVLPTLPPLKLPAVPSAEFELPELPELPRFTLPELPELPSLPKVELPDLPPPPKIPALFGSVEAVLNIMKLVSKVMCILKNSPFVPEWRAGDQIAYLTERNGYLPLDFIDIQPPAFSYSAISAIKVSAYVNLEFDMEFIVEAVRTITEPLDSVTNNIVNMFNIQSSDLDFTGDIPEKIDMQLELDGDIETDISLAPLNTHPENINLIVGMLAGTFVRFLDNLESRNNTFVSNEEFVYLMQQELSSPEIIGDHRTQALRDVWKEVTQLQSTKQDAYIQALQKNAQEKFDTIESILEEEIEYTKQQQKILKNLGAPNFITKVTQKNSGKERFEYYEEKLLPYNEKVLDASITLVSGESEETKNFRESIEAGGKQIMDTVRGGLSSYKEKMLAAEVTGDSTSGGGGVCNPQENDEYRYEGIYVLEHGKNYRLFSYVDRLRGDETPHIVDLENDGDEDVLYLVDGTLYFKENTTQTAVKEHVLSNPSILSSDDNLFFNGASFQEALNYFEATHISDGAINVSFLRPTDSQQNAFRMLYYTIVDRYIDQRDTFTPQNVEAHIIDAFADTDAREYENYDDYSIAPHYATLEYAGAMNGVSLITDILYDISQDLRDGNSVTLTAQSSLYSGGQSVKIRYQKKNSDQDPVTMTLPSKSEIRFSEAVDILELDGSLFVSKKSQQEIKDTDIIREVGRPLFPGSEIRFNGNVSALDESSHIDVSYFNGTDIGLDMREIKSYKIYDLGTSNAETYHIRSDAKNDFYYARIQPLSQNSFSNISQQILLAPQKEADRLPPQLGVSQKIRIPVYQKQKIDLTPYIYEDGGISGIQEVKVDFDILTDTDADTIPNNDQSPNLVEVKQTSSRIELEFGPYNTLFSQKIGITLVDDNGNSVTRDVNLEIYSPNPSIENIDGKDIIGQIDENLGDEPVRLYRYRGGVVQKIQDKDGKDYIDTDTEGNYSFELGNTSSGVILTHSGTQVAAIDEYSGIITLKSALASTRVLPSNHQNNDSVYPEIQIYQGGELLLRQFIKMPEGEARIMTDDNTLLQDGIYVRLREQENYGIYKIPLGTPYNPASVSVYAKNDDKKKALLTAFQDGRIHIDRSKFRLEYGTKNDSLSLNLIEISTGEKIAEVIYKLEGSYILR